MLRRASRCKHGCVIEKSLEVLPGVLVLCSFWNKESPACVSSHVQGAYRSFFQRWLFTWSSWPLKDPIRSDLPSHSGIALSWLASSQLTESSPPFLLKRSGGSYSPTSSNPGGTTYGSQPKCPVTSTLHSRCRTWLRCIPVP